MRFVKKFKIKKGQNFNFDLFLYNNFFCEHSSTVFTKKVDRKTYRVFLSLEEIKNFFQFCKKNNISFSWERYYFQDWSQSWVLENKSNSLFKGIGFIQFQERNNVCLFKTTNKRLYKILKTFDKS